MELYLSTRLREGTMDSHKRTEQSPFIRTFFSGQLSVEIYREFLLQLYHIYQTMEKQLQIHKNHSTLGKLYFPGLFRQNALEEDLNFYYKNDFWKEIHPREATKVYMQRLDQLSDEWVEGLIAHHYTRYLGDLSGGQVLKRMIVDSFKLSANEGIAFYEFSQIPDHKKFKNDYRAILDDFSFDENTIQNIVKEAINAFELNRQVFDSMMNLVEQD